MVSKKFDTKFQLNQKVQSIKNKCVKEGIFGDTVRDKLIDYFFEDITSKASDFYNTEFSKVNFKKNPPTADNFIEGIENNINLNVKEHKDHLSGLTMGNVFKCDVSDEILNSFEVSIRAHLSDIYLILKAQYQEYLDQKNISIKTLSTANSSKIAAWGAFIIGLVALFQSTNFESLSKYFHSIH